MKPDIIERFYTESEYYDVVRSTILHMVKSGINKFDLDDCISEVYLTALRKRRELEKHPNIHGWLASTSRIIAKRYMKSKMIESMLISDAYDNYRGSRNNSDEEQRLYNELLDLLKRELKRSEYQLFTLKFIEKIPTAEIAAIIGIKPHSVESRVTRLKAKIKNILKKT